MAEICMQTDSSCIMVFLLESVQWLHVWEVQNQPKSLQDQFGWRFSFEPSASIWSFTSVSYRIEVLRGS